MIGTIVTLAGKRPLYVVTEDNCPYYTCTPVIGGATVVCKRGDIKIQSIEHLLKRYENLSPRHATASFAHNLPVRKKEAMRFTQRMYRRGTQTQ